MTLGIDPFARTSDAQPVETDPPTPRIEGTVGGQLADAANIDPLARIDADHTALAQVQHRAGHVGGAGVLGAGSEAQTRAATLGEDAFDRIFLVQLRRPALQRISRFCAAAGAQRLLAKRYTGIVTSTRVPSTTVRPSLPVMS